MTSILFQTSFNGISSCDGATATGRHAAVGDQVEVINLGQVQIRIFGGQHFLETVFPDGTRVPAIPQDTDEYRATAQRLGYGTDIWALCREHEIAHTLVARALGLEYSPTLWAVAHGRTVRTELPGEMAAEEDLVLAYQIWCKVRGRTIE